MWLDSACLSLVAISLGFQIGHWWRCSTSRSLPETQLFPAQAAAARCSLSAVPRTPKFVALSALSERYFPHQLGVSATLTTPSSTIFVDLSVAQVKLSVRLGAFYSPSQSWWFVSAPPLRLWCALSLVFWMSCQSGDNTYSVFSLDCYCFVSSCFSEISKAFWAFLLPSRNLAA